MTVETALAIVVGAAWACYLVWKWQEAVVDPAIPPYQEPVKKDMVDEWIAAAPPKAEVEPTALNPKATWPFPVGGKP